MKVCLISDTHNRHKEIQIPEADMIIHSGDFSLQGTEQEFMNFIEWFSNLKIVSKILVAGNHDFFCENNPKFTKQLCDSMGIHYLEDSWIPILDSDGNLFKIHGSPYQPRFFDWAFNLDRNGPELAQKWAMISEDTNILVTHSPAFGKLDLIPSGLHVGCELLAERLPKLPSLKLHTFGHIHHSYGHSHGLDYQSVNASNCNERYLPINPPIVVEI